MIIMKILTWAKGRLVGEDACGNKYFEERFLFSRPERAPRRWVQYATFPDPSKIPAAWHGWMHFTYENPLTPRDLPWQKKHLQNMTGTPYAVRPKGSLLNDDPQPSTPSYTPWRPHDETGSS
jgi:NADH:ubiquinone oxidoreductase subunit